jgi:hypothetical protein
MLTYATDADEGDLVLLNTFDRDTEIDGIDLFGKPFNASKRGSFSGTSTAATLVC